MKTKSRNFLITILLAFMLVCSIFAITPLTAKAEEIDAGSVSVNNCSFSTNKLYYKNNSSETTNDSENYNAFYNPDTNTLVLNNYNGDCISIGGAIQENINIILVGNNVITTQDQRALSNTNGGGIYITAENDATLTINSTGSQSSVFGIYTGSWGEGKLDISGNADVRININSDIDNSIYGTYIDGAIEIKDNAKLSVEISSQNTLSGYTVGMGLYAKKTITINTTNSVLVDTTGIPSSNGNMGVYSDAGVTLTNASQLKVLVSYGNYAVAVYPATSVNAWSGFQETTNIANNILTTTYTPIEYFDITFNANGGTGTMQAVEYVGEYTLPNCTFTAPNGKQFKGWATTANGEVINGTYNVTAVVELFAIWEAVATGITATYTGEILAETTINPSGISIILTYSDSSTEPVNAGNVEYWYNGSQIQDPINYVFGVELIGNLNITVKYQGFETTMAVQVVGYEISFNANTGSGTMESVEYVGAYTLPTCQFTAPNGKQFKGWALASDGEVINGIYNVTADVELFAIWEDIPVVKFDVTFNANGGTGTMQGVEFAGTYTLPTCEFTAPDGKKFKGWSTSANGEVINGTTYNVAADVELYAIWEDIPVVNYTITFNANGGTGTMQAVEYVGEYTLPTCTFTAPDGKQFKGWALASDGEVIDGTYNVTANVELYAIWENIPAHEHNHGTAWESDANNHWNECSCGDKANVGAHVDSDNNGKCDTCDYQMSNGGGTSEQPENPEQPKDGLGTGAIIGIVVGGVVVLGLGGFALVWFVIKKKSFADLVAVFKKK